MLSPAIKLLRPKQWVKGLLVCAALLFTNKVSSGGDWLKIIVALVSISAASSATYIFNDWMDRERDKAHPRKKLRPLASGAVSEATAIILGVVCLAIAFLCATWLGPKALAIVGLYLCLQLAYNFGLKHVAVADVFVLSAGYVIRAALGAIAINVAISQWLYFCTGLLALFVSIGKRYAELQAVGSSGRTVLEQYTRESLKAMIYVTAAGASLSYGIYAIESPTGQNHPYLAISIIWVYYAVIRYLHLLFSQEEGGEPETLFLKDRHLLVSVGLFLVTAAAAMSIGKG